MPYISKIVPTALGIVLAAYATLTILPANASQTSDFTRADSFAGAYLAGGAALSDYDFAAATFYYGEALKFDPENVDLQRELLVSLINDGRFDEALPYAEKLKSVVEIERVSRLALGVDAIRKGEFDQAQVLLILSEENDIERLLTGIMRAWAQFGAGNNAQAIASIDALQGPEWFNLFKSYHSALIADAGGRKDVAKKYFEDGINNATGGSASPLTYLRLAEAYALHSAKDGQVPTAQEIIARGLAIAPNNPDLLRLQETLSENTANTFIQTATDGVGEILLNIGSAINREGAETFASIYLELARVARPLDAQTLFELGSIADRLNLVEKAISFYAAVPSTSPLYRPAALQQGLALSALERNEEAIKTLRALAAENPSDYGGHMALGGVLAVEKRFEEVIEVYKEALNYIDGTDARFWPIHYRLAIAYERTKQWPLAEATFKKALELSPNQPDVLNYLGYSWIDMNINLDEGLEMIKKAVEMRPEDGYIIDSLGWAQYRLGNFEEAVVSLEKATDLRPRDPTINDHLGDAYWRVGRRLEAAFQWSQVLGMDSEDVDQALIRAKLEAANSGANTPLVAESSVDKNNGTNQVVKDEKPKVGTNGG
ncbi:MAG: tetratricopeptide repeat protein [Ahrensia sp.]|nr:tetratricopeptide repeat protein [Ahrensia sp.]